MSARLLLCAVIVALATAAPGFAQGGRGRPCDMRWQSRGGMNRLPTAGGKFITFLGGGVRASCAGTNMVMQGDSAELNDESRVYLLIGKARYTEDGGVIESNMMQYFEAESRIMAYGDVRARTRTGATLNIANLNYFRPIPTRNYSIAEGFGRSHLVLRDSAKVPDSLATIIDSYRLRMERDSLFYAGGNVIITRPDMIATADSAATTSDRKRARLVTGSPKIVGKGANSFTLQGNILDIFGKEDAVERLLAQGEADALGDSLHLTADTIDIRTSKGGMDHVSMRSRTRSRATAPDRDISAMRIELAMPGQKLQSLLAIGRAHIETKPDSLVKSAERDWIDGDTVTATFDLTVKRDTSEQPPLRDLVARGNARSFQQTAPQNRTDTLPTINYVTGNRIDVRFASGRVQEVRVLGNVSGIGLEPVRDSVPPKPPTTGRGGTAGRRAPR